PLAEPVIIPGGVKCKPPFEMGVANLDIVASFHYVMIHIEPCPFLYPWSNIISFPILSSDFP
ncbi:MAG: hypothetical protein K1W26_11715, partial [Acetatifactor sp.]